MGGGGGGFDWNPLNSSLFRGSPSGQAAAMIDQTNQAAGGAPGTGNSAIDSTLGALKGPANYQASLDQSQADAQAQMAKEEAKKQADAEAAANRKMRQEESDTFTNQFTGAQGKQQLMQSLQGLQDQARRLRGRKLFGG